MEMNRLSSSVMVPIELFAIVAAGGFQGIRTGVVDEIIEIRVP